MDTDSLYKDISKLCSNGFNVRTLQGLRDACIFVVENDSGASSASVRFLVLRALLEDVLLLADTEGFPYTRALDNLEGRYWECLVNALLACAKPASRSSEMPSELTAAIACLYSRPCKTTAARVNASDQG